MRADAKGTRTFYFTLEAAHCGSSDFQFLIEKGIQAAIDFLRQRNPPTPNVKVQDFMDNRFIKELDHSGFIQKLYAG